MFFLWFNTSKYEGPTLERFANENDLLAFLNQRAGNEELEFTVVDGREVKMKAVEVAKKYVIER